MLDMLIHFIQLVLARVSQCGCVFCADTSCSAELFALLTPLHAVLLFFRIKKKGNNS